jgi:hypothetical protein
MEALYRWRGDVRGQPGPTHHRVACPRGHPCHQVVWWPHGPPSSSPSDFVSCREK